MPDQRLVTYARNKATSMGLDPDIFVSMLSHENSTWDNSLTGDGGAAVGIGQLHRGAVADVGGDYTKAATDPYANIDYAAAYLKQQKDKFGNYYDALRAYNQGAGGARSDSSKGAAYASAILKDSGSASSTGKTGETQADSGGYLPIKDGGDGHGNPGEVEAANLFDLGTWGDLLFGALGVIVIIVLVALGLWMLGQGQYAQSMKSSVASAAAVAKAI